NVLPVNNNSLVHDNSALDRLKHKNDRLMELLISKDLVHTAVNSLAAINDYKSMEQSFVDEYEEILKLQTELANKNDMIEKAELPVYVSATCPSTKHVSDKLLVVTPINRTRKVRTNQYSFLCLCYNKTPYELMHDKKPDLSYLHVFGSLCYLTNDNEDLGKLKAKADIAIFIGYAPVNKAFRIYNKRTQLIMETIHVIFNELTTMASKQFSSGPAPQLMTLRTLSSGLVPNPITQPPYVSPTKNDWDILFQPMFDEFFNLPPSFVSSVPTAAALRLVDLTGSPVSTSLEHNAPSASTSSTKKQEHSLIISQGVKESPKTPHFYDDPLHETLHTESTSQGSSSNILPAQSPQERNLRLTQRGVILMHFSLHINQRILKKHCLLESSWNEAMQEEIHEFEILQVWELVPCLDLVMLIKLKWIFKVKKDECGGVLKNKARLVSKGYRQEEGIDFEESFAPVV
nr:integrase, catalytic region, zinc finger, CCHC-type, peptidase aspartic, catalytic [Tanacetum cinerariifolium]